MAPEMPKFALESHAVALGGASGAADLQPIRRWPGPVRAAIHLGAPLAMWGVILSLFHAL